jgi:vacuolar-type H+-ATPase subunit D/Vma8
MSTGQRLRQVKEDIDRIERFLPVMKRVLTMLRVEIRTYQERIEDLEYRQRQLELRWEARGEHALGKTIEASLEAEILIRTENLVGVDIEEVKAVKAHCRLSQVLICQSAASAAISDLAIERLQLSERLRIERSNVARLEDAEEEFVFLINGSEQVRLPPLHEELARLARALDEENGMAASIARLLREREADKHQELETWPLLG